MNPIRSCRPARPRTHLQPGALTLAALMLVSACGAARADERSDLEQLRATTVGLIEALVGQGLLTRERADALLRPSQSPAPPGTWGAPPAAGAAAAPATRNVVRVPYLSETVRSALREEIKLDVLAQARDEGWADARQIPSWVKGVSVEGDVRVRWQSDRFADASLFVDPDTGFRQPCIVLSGNLPAECYRSQGLPPVSDPAWSPDLANTTVDRNRLTLRARVGVNAKLSDETSAGIRLSTGGTTAASTASQTLGTDFNRYAATLDRAWLRWEPVQDLRLIAGRLPNPFYSTDLLWPDDLNFDGVAVQAEHNLASGVYAFATAGVFPLEEFAVDRHDKWLYGVQVGADAALTDQLQWRIGLALYDFDRVEGVRETELPPVGQRAGTVPYLTSQYPVGARQRGNTLINLCPATSAADTPSPCANGGPVWGLASKFRPLNLTTGLTFKQFDPLQVNLTLDWVKNSAFDLADIRSRSGLGDLALADKSTGLQVRALVGMARLASKGDWQAYAAMRKFERDAWVDGFTDTSWNGGGTGYKGWTLGGNFAFDRNTSLGVRYLSTRNLDDGTDNLSSAPFKLDTLQVDLSARF